MEPPLAPNGGGGTCVQVLAPHSLSSPVLWHTTSTAKELRQPVSAVATGEMATVAGASRAYGGVPLPPTRRHDHPPQGMPTAASSTRTAAVPVEEATGRRALPHGSVFAAAVSRPGRHLAVGEARPSAARALARAPLPNPHGVAKPRAPEVMTAVRRDRTSFARTIAPLLAPAHGRGADREDLQEAVVPVGAGAVPSQATKALPDEVLWQTAG